MCDYSADTEAFTAALGDEAITIRCNANPARLGVDSPDLLATEFARDLALFRHPIAGTGILPYDFDPEQFPRFRVATLSRLIF